MDKKESKEAMITEETAADQLRKRESAAKDYLDHPEKLRKLLEDGAKKAKSIKGPLDDFADTLKVLFSLGIDYLNGSYKTIPVGSILVIIGAIIYFVSPIDLIPDFLPIIGLTDDVIIVGFAYKQVKSDIEKYKQWKGL